jgi:hypothetical protein
MKVALHDLILSQQQGKSTDTFGMALTRDKSRVSMGYETCYVSYPMPKQDLSLSYPLDVDRIYQTPIHASVTWVET